MFEVSQLYKFLVYDSDDNGKKEFLGETIIDIG